MKCPSCKHRDADYLKLAKKYRCDTCALAEGFLVKCTGEAHSNPFIDHCGACMPRWGLVEVNDPALRDALSEEKRELCLARRDGYSCTRTKGHEPEDHIAGGTDGAVTRWKVK